MSAVVGFEPVGASRRLLAVQASKKWVPLELCVIIIISVTLATRRTLDGGRGYPGRSLAQKRDALNPESSPLITSAEAVITGHIEHTNN